MIDEKEYFLDKRVGWVKPEKNTGRLATSLMALADAFKKLAEVDRAEQLEIVDRLKLVMESRGKE